MILIGLTVFVSM